MVRRWAIQICPLAFPFSQLSEGLGVCSRLYLMPRPYPCMFCIRENPNPGFLLTAFDKHIDEEFHRREMHH